MEFASDPPLKKMKHQPIQPRRYQIDALQRAMKENTIVYLETGSGKTQIAVMLINSVAESLSLPHKKCIAVFLAPTVYLVNQQARVLSAGTELKIGVYYGEKGVDTWSILKWQEEVENHQVLIMTPQIFLDALSTSALKLELVEVLIMDECHHANGGHPYAQIMRTHYHVPFLKHKPKILGLTASPIIKKGVSSDFHCARTLEALEDLLDAKVFTLEDTTELEACVPTPAQHVEYYAKRTSDFSLLKIRIAALLERYTDEINSMKNANQLLKDKMVRSISRLHNAIDHCISDLGLIPASLAVEVLLKEDTKARHSEWRIEQLTEEELEVKKQHRDQFLYGVWTLLKESLRDVPENFYETIDAVTHGEPRGFLTPKVILVLNLLMRYKNAEYMRCMIFVERVVVSGVLAKLISGFKFLNQVNCEYLTGVNDLSRTATQQQQILDDFAVGKLNLLITTSVAEEGLDVQKCSAVVRFDLCQTLRSHVQSRGRARRQESNYVWLLESGNKEHEKLLFELTESEKLVKEQGISKTNSEYSTDPPPQGDLEVFRVDSGACKTTQDSVSFIHRYCATLPGDRYYTPKPTFSFKETDGIFICTVKFPPNAPLSYVEGPPCRTEELSKKHACLEACKHLYAIGAVRSDTLCPDVDGREVEEEDSIMPKNSSKTGKLKELISTAKPDVFNGGWLNTTTQVQLQFYKLTFSIDPTDGHTYSSFALLLQGILDCELGNIRISLHTTKNRVVNANLCFNGPIKLDRYQINSAKAYHELIFNGAFNRLSDCFTTPQGMWDERQSYLLLPLSENCESIDWTGISSAAAALSNYRTSSYGADSSSLRDVNMLYMAGELVHVSSVQDCVVVAVHNGRIFCISGILENTNAESQIPGESFSYVKYYEEKYGIRLLRTHQPLLKAKQTHAMHNLLLRKHIQKNIVGKEREEKYVELPAELCLLTGLKSALMRSLYFIPSFMHRFISMVSAGQLRSTIFQRCPQVSALQILETLTSKRCEEEFSYESLELLGDSFLKYAVTRSLFLVYSNKHEGQLSARRSRATCNATLNHLAKKAGISQYIYDGRFEPSSWFAPGMYVSHTLVCKHDSNILTSYDEDIPSMRGICINGHRWIRWKAFADVIEALIGAYLITNGPESAENFMKILGISEVEYNFQLLEKARQRKVPYGNISKHILDSLEHTLHYTFQNKCLLVEAITHASEPNSNVCYQRLEFLGDGVLDYLVSKHLYESHPGLPPGVLTDLRSAAVNNGCFARAVIKHGLHNYLRHGSGELHRQIGEFMTTVFHNGDASFHGFEAVSGPKVLGDLLESIAGAIFIDTGFNLTRVWEVMHPLLSPIVTPGTVQLHPFRELKELSQSKGFSVEYSRKRDGNITIGEMIATIGEKQYIETSEQKQKGAAKREAAQKMLLTLQKLGLRHARAKTADPTQGTSSKILRELSTEEMTPREDEVINSKQIERPRMKILQRPSGETVNQSQGCQRIIDTFQQPSEEIINQIQTAKFQLKACSSQSGNSVCSEQTATNTPLTLPPSIACELDQKGRPRAYLKELSDSKRTWTIEFKPEMKGSKFICSVIVNVEGKHVLCETSCSMTRKDTAQDDAAKKMILRLANMGLLS